jgi:hypothetical protein
MSGEQKMEFLYNWCFQMSEVIQELRATTQTLMDKVVLVEAMLTERPGSFFPCLRPVRLTDLRARVTVEAVHLEGS